MLDIRNDIAICVVNDVGREHKYLFTHFRRRFKVSIAIKPISPFGDILWIVSQ